MEMKSTTIKKILIDDIYLNLSSNKLVLPEIQREYVWKEKDIVKLFDSLMRDYPIGQLMFWPASVTSSFVFYDFINDFSEKDTHNHEHNKNGESDLMAVLDGQQRLTALYIGLKGSYERKINSKETKYKKEILYLNLINNNDDIDENKYEFKFINENEVKNDIEHYWFRVGEILDYDSKNHETKKEELSDKIEQFYGEKIDKSKVIEAKKIVGKLYEVICSDNRITYEEIDKNKSEDEILDIFVRANNGGKKLDYADLLLSTATATWNSNARDLINNLVDELNDIDNKNFNFSKDFVLKASLVLLDAPDVKFKISNFNKEIMKKLELDFPKISKSLKIAIEVVSKYGYNDKSLTAKNAVIPLAYYIFKKKYYLKKGFVRENKYKDDRKQMMLWLNITLIKHIFSSQTDTLLKDIRDTINKEVNKKCDKFPFRAIYELYDKNATKNLRIDDGVIDGILDLEKEDKQTFAALSIIYPKLDYINNTYEKDHIQPASKFNIEIFKEHKLSGKQIEFYQENYNKFANLQLLNTAENQEKLDKFFDDWLINIKKYSNKEIKAYCNENYINEKYISFDNFEEMINARKAELRKILKKVLSDNM